MGDGATSRSVLGVFVMSQTLADSAHGDDDFLAKWTRWLSNGANNSTGGDAKAALEDGLMRFRNDEAYRNNEQYLKLWMNYADMADNTNKVFLFLESESICTQLALFWAAWAYVLEMDDSYEGALHVIATGFARGARPSSLLEEFRDAFDKRMQERIRIAPSDSGKKTTRKGRPAFPRTHDEPTRHITTGQGQLSVTTTTSEALASCAISAPACSPALELAQLDLSDHGRVPLISGRGSPINHACDQLGRRRGRHKRSHCEIALTTECRPIYEGDETIVIVGPARDMPGKPSATSAGRPLGSRDMNTMVQPPPSYDEHRMGCRLHRLARGSVDRNFGATKMTLVQDPFSPQTRKSLTTSSAHYIRWASSPNNIVHDYRHEKLAKRWPRKMGKTKSGSRREVALARTLGTRRFFVLGVLGEGASAVVFSCKAGEDHRHVAVKIELQGEAPLLPWECFITLQLHERLQCRCQTQDNDGKHLAIEVVRPEALFLYRDGCAMTTPEGPFGTLHDLVVIYGKNAKTMPQLVAMHYAIEMLQVCRAVHSVSILHMDIKPDNWLLTTRPAHETGHREDGGHPSVVSESISLIDFGRAIDLSIFPHNGEGIAFTGACGTPSFSCPAMVEGRAWKHDADLFALGSCIYFMLHGVHLEVCCDEEQESGSWSASRRRRWRPARQCRRYWEVDLWDNIFDELLNGDCRKIGSVEAEETLGRLQNKLLSYTREAQRSRELEEHFRRQKNMLCNK